MDQKLIGRYIVSDPRVCHGKPTFRGTRIMVSQVLEQVSARLAWETIVEEWRGTVTTEAIAEAVRLTSEGVFVPAKISPDQIRELAAQVYAGLSAPEIADVEKIALDRSNFVDARP